jgi:hypothetical protein
LRGEWFKWRGIVPRVVEAALDPLRWKSELRLPPIMASDLDWQIGSPLYAGNADYPQYQAGADFEIGST